MTFRTGQDMGPAGDLSLLVLGFLEGHRQEAKPESVIRDSKEEQHEKNGF